MSTSSERRTQAFANAWQEAEEIATDRLEDEARRRAIEGVPEPLVSAGKLVRDDDGQPITVRRYSDHLLLALLKAHRPSRRERSVRFQLLALRSAADAASAMAALTAGVAAGDLTPGEAVQLSRLVEAYVRRWRRRTLLACEVTISQATEAFDVDRS